MWSSLEVLYSILYTQRKPGLLVRPSPHRPQPTRCLGMDRTRFTSDVRSYAETPHVPHWPLVFPMFQDPARVGSQDPYVADSRHTLPLKRGVTGSHPRPTNQDPKSGWPLLKSPKNQIPLDSRTQDTRRERARAGEREAGRITGEAGVRSYVCENQGTQRRRPTPFPPIICYPLSWCVIE